MPEDDETAVVAEALQQVADVSQDALQGVDETLASVAEQVYELLTSAAIDLSEEDIRELLGEHQLPVPTKEASDKTAKSPLALPVVHEEGGHADEEDLRTASTSAPSTPDKSFDHDEYLHTSPDLWTPTLSQPGTLDLGQVVTSVLPESVDEPDTASVSTQATTATRRELKNRVSELEGYLGSFTSQMQELTTRLVAAETQEQSRRSTVETLQDNLETESRNEHYNLFCGTTAA